MTRMNREQKADHLEESGIKRLKEKEVTGVEESGSFMEGSEDDPDPVPEEEDEKREE